jgi:hypothetical protein
MRENRPCGSEGGEAKSLPYPYQKYLALLLLGRRLLLLLRVEQLLKLVDFL